MAASSAVASALGRGRAHVVLPARPSLQGTDERTGADAGGSRLPTVVRSALGPLRAGDQCLFYGLPLLWGGPGGTLARSVKALSLHGSFSAHSSIAPTTNADGLAPWVTPASTPTAAK
jgi:hypothetical protein